MNNFEKIKAMDIDEMVELLIDDCRCCIYYDDLPERCLKTGGCFDGIKLWLESEVRE